MKIIKVDSCCNCPYLDNMADRAWWCQHPSIVDGYGLGSLLGNNTRETLMSIPAACPLEDEKDLIPALDLLQKHLEKGDYIDYDRFCRKGSQRQLALWNTLGELIISGTTIRELLVNLSMKEQNDVRADKEGIIK